MRPYKSPFVKIAFFIFCLMLAIMLREMVRAESDESDRMNIIQYEPSECPVSDEIISQDRMVKLNTLNFVQPEQTSETYTVTAYCSCQKCCGEWAIKRNGGPVIGAYGVELTPWYSVAAPLPYGTKLEIDGMTYEVQDTTASWIVDRYSGKVIDIYVGGSHEEALRFGKQELEVTIIE